jgi:hypothetical protein
MDGSRFSGGLYQWLCTVILMSWDHGYLVDFLGSASLPD